MNLTSKLGMKKERIMNKDEILAKSREENKNQAIFAVFYVLFVLLLSCAHIYNLFSPGGAQ